MQHRVRQICGLGAAQAFEQGSHQPRGNLIVRNLPERIAADQIINFGAGKFVAVTFLADYVNGADRAAARGFAGVAHCRRNPSGRRSAMGSSFHPEELRKKTTASGPNCKITWRQAPQGEQGAF